MTSGQRIRVEAIKHYISLVGSFPHLYTRRSFEPVVVFGVRFSVDGVAWSLLKLLLCTVV